VGFFAQFCSSFISTPRDVIKERLQVQQLQQFQNNINTSAWGIFKGILNTDGIPGLFRGYWQTLFLWSVYGGLYLALYTKSKAALLQYYNKTYVNSSDKKGNSDLSPMPVHWVLTAAISSAAFSAVVTNPLDVIKLHYQVKTEKESFFKIFHRVNSVYGPRAWMRGAIARVLYISPRTAIAFTTYDMIQNLLLSY